MKLNDTQIQEFFEKGYILLENTFSKEEVANLLDATDKIYEISKKFKKTCLYNDSRFVFSEKYLHRVVWAGAQDSRLLEVAQDKRITEPVSQLLESESLVQIINQLHFKMPGDGVQFPYHQDSENRGYGSPLWKDINGKGSYVQTVLALDPMTKENGPLQFLPYSCSNGHLALDNKAEEKVDLSKLEIIEMNPGTLALFGPYTIHGSLPNHSEYSRKVLINGYASPGANKKIYPGCGVGQTINL